MNAKKAVMLVVLSFYLILIPLMMNDLYQREDHPAISILAMVGLSIALALAIWQFVVVARFRIYKKSAFAGTVCKTGTGKRWMEIDIPGFGLWDLEVPRDMAMRQGDIVKLTVKVDCHGPDPRIVPIKFGNINDRK